MAAPRCCPALLLPEAPRFGHLQPGQPAASRTLAGIIVIVIVIVIVAGGIVVVTSRIIVVIIVIIVIVIVIVIVVIVVIVVAVIYIRVLRLDPSREFRSTRRPKTLCQR